MSVGTHAIGTTSRRINRTTVLAVCAAFAVGVGIGLLIEYDRPVGSAATAPAAQATWDTGKLRAAELRALGSSLPLTHATWDIDKLRAAELRALPYSGPPAPAIEDVDDVLAVEHRAQVG